MKKKRSFEILHQFYKELIIETSNLALLISILPNNNPLITPKKSLKNFIFYKEKIWFKSDSLVDL